MTAATTQAVAIPIPPSTAWRRPDAPTVTYQKGSDGAGDTSSSSNEKRRGLMGVLTRRSTTHGGGGGERGNHRGKGVRTGDRRAKEPLLDMTEESKFVPGSLLARVEEKKGDVTGGALRLTVDGVFFNVEGDVTGVSLFFSPACG